MKSVVIVCFRSVWSILVSANIIVNNYDMYRRECLSTKDQFKLESSDAPYSFVSMRRSVVRRLRAGDADERGRDHIEGSFRRRAIS